LEQKNSLLKNLKGGKTTMRNLKRVLSLALATVMLLGMMVMGTSAKDISEFPDADQIDDYAREAVAITTGLGIFTGEAGTGNFNPNGTVDRAQLATIICKILVLEGTVDYDLLKGSENSFPDARTYQQGWAEGYINYCQATGIVRGYPNGTFGAADDVITWHAALALERAIGYYRENEKNGEALDETVVTSRGIEIGLYGDMSLSINHVLTRQELAVMVYNALFAQRVVYSADRKDYVKANNYNVVPNNSTEDPYNTLAYGTFYLVAEDGVVVRNSAVDPSLAGTDKVGASTMVDMYNKDHKLTGLPRSFEYETGTNLIGHAVTVYYSEAHKVKNVMVPEKVYAMTDQATATGMITYATLSNSNAMDYTTMNRAAVEQGFKTRTLGANAQEYNINYDLDVMVKDTCFKNGTKVDKVTPIEKGDYILLISNEPTREVEYAIVLKQYVDEIDIEVNRFEETINSVKTFGLSGPNSLYLQDELVDGDDVIVTPNCFDGNGMPTYAVVQAADTQKATVEEVVGLSLASNTYRTVTADGVKYTESPVSTANMPSSYTPFQKISQLTETTLVKDLYGQLIAITQDKVKPNTELVYVSQFGYKYGEISSLKDNIVLTAEIWHADGTSEIITVNTKANITTAESGKPLANGVIAKDSSYTDDNIIFALAKGTKSVNIEANYNDLNAAGNEPTDKNGVACDNGGTFLGVWKIEKLSDGTYSLNKPADTNAAELGKGYVLASDTTGGAGSDQHEKAVRIVTGHSTFLQGSNNSSHATLTGWTATSQQQYKDALLQTNDTIYWYVDGNYGDPSFSVKASVGISNQSNMVLHGLPTDNDGTWAEEAWVNIAGKDKDGNPDPTGGDHYIKAMVIHGVGAVDDLGVCYYNQGSWSIRSTNNEYVVTFQAYDAEGNEVYFPYSYKTYTEAEQASRGGQGLVNPETLVKDGDSLSGIPSGYYTFYSNKIVAVSDGKDNYAVVKKGYWGEEVLNGDQYRGTVYVADATATKADKVGGMNNMKAIYNLFTPASPQAIIYTDARVIDLKDGVYNTVESLYNAMDSEVIMNVQISYSYSRTNYQCPVLYVIDYDYKSVAGGPDKPNEPKDIINADKLGAELDYSKHELTVNYIAGEENPYDVGEAFLVSKGYTVNNWYSGSVNVTRSTGNRITFDTDFIPWYKVTVDGTLVAYMNDGRGNGAVVPTAKVDGDKGAGFIANISDADTFDYANYAATTNVSADHHVTISKGYGEVAAAFSVDIAKGDITIKSVTPAVDYAKPGSTLTVDIAYIATGAGGIIELAKSDKNYSIASNGKTEILKATTGTDPNHITVTIKIDADVAGKVTIQDPTITPYYKIVDPDVDAISPNGDLTITSIVRDESTRASVKDYGKVGDTFTYIVSYEASKLSGTVGDGKPGVAITFNAAKNSGYEVTAGERFDVLSANSTGFYKVTIKLVDENVVGDSITIAAPKLEDLYWVTIEDISGWAEDKRTMKDVLFVSQTLDKNYGKAGDTIVLTMTYNAPEDAEGINYVMTLTSSNYTATVSEGSTNKVSIGEGAMVFNLKLTSTTAFKIIEASLVAPTP